LTRQALRDRFVAVLTGLGGSAGNGRLRDTLGWAETTYDAVKAELIADGFVTPGRGRGGSVSLADAKKAEAVQAKLPAPVRASAALTRANGAGKGGDLGFEAELFKAADKLRGNMEPSDYKHVALGLIFLKHISDRRCEHPARSGRSHH
jgi:type I restriction enzyme M protein